MEDSSSVESLAGMVVSQMFLPETRSQLCAAWDDVPPGVRIDGVRVAQSAQRLPPLLVVHDATRSDVLRHLGEHLLDEGVATGEYEGTDIRDLRATRSSRGISLVRVRSGGSQLNLAESRNEGSAGRG